MRVVEKNISDALPRTLAEFIVWESNDGFKYEWNDGKLIKFSGIGKYKINIYSKLFNVFAEASQWKSGTFISGYELNLSSMQVRIPDIAYLSNAQLDEADKGGDPVPGFVVEIISETDNINKVLLKVAEYYKAGVKVVWLVFPEVNEVHVYTSQRNVKICIETDICSAGPVLPEFEIGVDVLFA